MPSRSSAETGRQTAARAHPHVRETALVAGLALLSACLSLILYRHTLVYGFDYDDYHFVRPYSVQDVLDTFHGPWDASGIEVPFYRPLTIAFFALRFEAFGLNAVA